MTEILFFSLLLWLGGFLGQKSSFNEDCKINTKSKFVLFLGIKPGSQPVYIRAAIPQIVAILMLLIGVIILWLFSDVILVKSVVFKFALVSLSIAVLLIGLTDLMSNRT